MSVTGHPMPAIEWKLRTAGDWPDTVDILISQIGNTDQYEIKKWSGVSTNQPNDNALAGWITAYNASGLQHPDGVGRQARKNGVSTKLGGLTDDDIQGLKEALQDGTI